jgi:hypothetical protein
VGTAFRIALALVAILAIWKAGTAILGSFARPVPPPLPEGEVRRIKLRYRCEMCGLELRTERAATEDPDPPRHCMDEMELIATAEDGL